MIYKPIYLVNSIKIVYYFKIIFKINEQRTLNTNSIKNEYNKIILKKK